MILEVAEEADTFLHTEEMLGAGPHALMAVASLVAEASLVVVTVDIPTEATPTMEVMAVATIITTNVVTVASTVVDPDTNVLV
jgi:hypothetical protein